MTQKHSLVRKVLLVSSSSGSHGGGELYLDLLAEGLCGLGCVVQSLLSSHPRMDALATALGRWGIVNRTTLITNTYDRKLRSLSSLLPRRSRALTELFRTLRPDVLHLNKQNVEDGLDLMLAANASAIPSTCTIHVTRGMTELGSALGPARDWVARRTLRRWNGEYIAIAHACRRQLNQYLGADVTVRAVPNGVRPAHPGERFHLWREWRAPPGSLVLGCVARIEDQKNPLLALDVLSRLPANVRLVWVGDGRLRSVFEAKAAELGLKGRVHVDGWRSDARQRMSGFDVFLLPSRYEGFPFAVLEAMAAGLPCVASDVDGAREAVIDGVTGWLCPPDQPSQWAARIGELLEAPGLRSAMGDAGRRRVAEMFSMETMARGTAAVYEAAIERRARAMVGVR